MSHTSLLRPESSSLEGVPALADLTTRLAGQTAFWEHWGFIPWNSGTLSGVLRPQHFIKSGILGRIAEFKAVDGIVFSPGAAKDREAFWRGLRPLPEVMTQRFLFLLPDPWPGRRIRSFWLGLRGYAEFYACDPRNPAAATRDCPADLRDLAVMALKLS